MSTARQLTVELNEPSSVPSLVHPSGESAQSSSDPSSDVSTGSVKLEPTNGFDVAFTVTHPSSEQTLLVVFEEPVETVTFAQNPEVSQ